MSDAANEGQTEVQVIRSDDGALLGKVMSLGGEAPAGSRSGLKWSEADMAAIWRHQLDAPLLLDLGGLSVGAGATVASYAQSGGASRTFGDLIGHPQPPLELLQLAKQFAKAQRYCGQGAFPAETALVIYYASIVLALLRTGRRITEMTDASLRQGIQWALQQAWLDAKTRSLFEEALMALTALGPS